MTTNIEHLVEKTVAVSNYHLKPETARKLSAGELSHIWMVYPNEYGAFVYTDQQVKETDLSEAPPEIQKILDFFKNLGIHWVKFDRDGEQFRELETFISCPDGWGVDKSNH
jgi:hypothetical protein